jgi:hypothetical protein
MRDAAMRGGREGMFAVLVVFVSRLLPVTGSVVTWARGPVAATRKALAPRRVRLGIPSNASTTTSPLQLHYCGYTLGLTVLSPEPYIETLG